MRTCLHSSELTLHLQYEVSAENQDNAEIVLGPDHGGSMREDTAREIYETIKDLFGTTKLDWANYTIKV